VKKKIIGTSVVVAFLAILCVQSVTATVPDVYVWTDKAQYSPGETGVLKISVLNVEDGPVEIHNITITYPWFVYDAEKGEWVGNATIEGDPLATMTSKGTENDHYYKEVKFTVPSDGRADMSGIWQRVNIATTEGDISIPLSISVAATSWPMSLADLDTWMTYLIVAIVVCTIILAIVVLLSKSKTRAPRALIPRAPTPPPPPKPKAKA
jgi:hypothetical protein